jgi:hypothetical protein
MSEVTGDDAEGDLNNGRRDRKLNTENGTDEIRAAAKVAISRSSIHDLLMFVEGWMPAATT